VQRFWLWIFVSVLLAWRAMPAVADTVTLNSGEVLVGRILSETDTQLVMEASFYHGTILSTREVARSDIRSIVRENVEQQREKADFEALAKYTLNPNQELARNQYGAGIAAFEKFLATYTNSSFATDVNQRLVDWRAEAANVESGKVKFAGAWMTPDEKKAQSAQEALQSLQKQLADLQAQRAAQAQNVAAAKKQLADAQSKLPSPQAAAGSGGRRDLAGRLTAGAVSASQGEAAQEPGSAPEQSQVQDEINMLRQQISQGQSALASLDAKIADTQGQIATREKNDKSASAQSSGTPPQTVAKAAQAPSPKPTRSIGTNAPAKAARPAAPAPEPPPVWYMRIWKWFHG
jgi:hypothetical protein